MATQSKPLTFAELQEGQKFTMLPKEGDNAGHGGFRKGGYLFTKLRASVGKEGQNCFNHRTSALQQIGDLDEVYLIHCDDLQVQ